MKRHSKRLADGHSARRRGLSLVIICGVLGCDRSSPTQEPAAASAAPPATAEVSAAPPKVGTTPPPPLHLIVQAPAARVHLDLDGMVRLAVGALTFRLDQKGLVQQADDAYQLSDVAPEPLPKLKPGEEYVAERVKWKGGKTLSVARNNSAKDWRFVSADEAATVGLPRAGSATGALAEAGCRTPLMPRRALGFDDGQLFVTGRRCSPESAPVNSIQHWKADSLQADLQVLPGGGTAEDGIVGTAPDDVTVAGLRLGKPYLAHFDGKKWTPLSTPAKAPIIAVATPRRGTLWIATRNGLFRRKDGHWSQLGLPNVSGGAVRVQRIVDTQRVGLWVEARSADSSRATARFIFGPTSVPALAGLPADSTSKGPADERKRLPPATSACRDLFVHIRSKVKQGQTFKAVKKALVNRSAIEGAQLLIAQAPDKSLSLGATVPSATVGKALLQLLEEAKLGPPAPQLACHKPRIVQRIQLAPTKLRPPAKKGR